ncbi:MAG TPA: S46 family peptidase [Steroidobacteraceae bacterium]|nr:S46 family peptidase [Steroidobacteraceae bacterium]
MSTPVSRRVATLCAALAAVVSGHEALADEGMWTLDNFPSAAVREKYHVDIGRDWLENARQGVTRHESGCTGSFASGAGLVLTNHHCALQCLAQLSSEREDLVGNGFIAGTREQERQCPGEILSVLMATEEVTAAVNAATKGLPTTQANEARKRELSKLEAACVERSKKDKATGPLQCESVTLYQGGQYFLYKYKRYDDVRLVFAPHEEIAAFGGDPDNFNFPRWSLDFSLMRAYEGGKPAATQHHFPWRVEGPKEGEPVFVFGHPGTTQRLFTPAQLAFQRDTVMPSYLLRNAEFRGRILQWAKSGPEPARIVQGEQMGVENSLKVYRQLNQALLDGRLIDLKTKELASLRERAGNKPELVQELDAAQSDIEAAMQAYRELYDRYLFLEAGAGFMSDLYDYAHALVRAAAERTLPNEQRLREYAESSLPKIRASVLAAQPIYPEFEQLKLSHSLEKLREFLGPDDSVVRKLLAHDSPDTLARRLISGTKLADVKVREQLWQGGEKAIAQSQDPMIVLARDLDPGKRAIRKAYEDRVQAPVAVAQERLARVRFAVLGTSTYPDATFTLRASYGAVTGWTEKGQDVPPFTHLDRLYERTTGQKPFALPQVWLDARAKLDPKTPFNYTTTNDIVGGNSGSPVIDAQGRLVGLAFDGNIHSIAGRYGYDPAVNRAIAVHPAIIMTALEQVYPARHLAAEIKGQ